MKKFTITSLESLKEFKDMTTRTGNCLVVEGDEDMQVSDGFHTMDEMYEHRITLFIALCNQIRGRSRDNFAEFGTSSIEDWENPVWRSKLHDDGSEFEGWFIMGIGEEIGKIITYHLPIEKWDETDFAETLDVAPEWDGHTSADVLERLKNL